MVNAEILATVNAKGIEGIASAYQEETTEFEARFFNNSEEGVTDLKAEVSVDEALAIVEFFKLEETKWIDIEYIPPQKEVVRSFKVKPLMQAEKPKIYVTYGKDRYENLVATFLEVRPSPLEINAELSKQRTREAERNSVKMEAKNIDENELKNLNIFLDGGKMILIEPKAVSREILNPDESLKEEFFFTPDATVMGEENVLLSISFEDKNGMHLVEKTFTVKVEEPNLLPYALIVIVIVAIIFLLFSRRKPSPQE